MKKIPWIYLASPYTHKDRNIEIARWSRVSAICAQIFATGEFYPYSPIAHSFCLVQEGNKHFGLNLNGDFNLWKAYDHAFMTKCDELWILQLDGWIESKGIKSETERASELGLPTHYVPNGSFKWVYKYIIGTEKRWEQQ